jgi:LacI family transcriptional regulator
VAKLMEAGVTGVVTGSDLMAIGAINGIRAWGKSVPGDVSVTGFDDIDLAHAVDPELTTVHVPHRRMGQRAAKVLLSLCAGEVEAVSEPLGTRLVEGGSLAAPCERHPAACHSRTTSSG